MEQFLFDLRFRSFINSFSAFFHLLALSARVHSHGKYVLCLHVIPDQDFNSIPLHFSYITLTIHYALVIWNVAK